MIKLDIYSYSTITGILNFSVTPFDYLFKWFGVGPVDLFERASHALRFKWNVRMFGLNFVT